MAKDFTGIVGQPGEFTYETATRKINIRGPTSAANTNYMIVISGVIYPPNSITTNKFLFKVFDSEMNVMQELKTSITFTA